MNLGQSRVGPRGWFGGCLWLCVCAIAATHAVAAQEEGAERTRIALERATAEKTFAERNRACQSRFAVTACVDDARRERRDTLALLRRQEVLLDESQRKVRAAQRVQAIRSKVSAADAQQRDLSAREPRETPYKVAAPDPAASTPVPREPISVRQRTVPTPPSPRAKRPAHPASGRAAQEARSKERFKASQEAAAVHREALERRNALRAGKGKAASPLPTPSSASAP